MAVPHQLLPRQWILPRGKSRQSAGAQIATFVSALDVTKQWRVIVEENRATRTSQQNRYLYGVAYKALSEATGYETDEIAEFCCGLAFGWKDKPVPKTPRNPEGVESVPVRTTTTDETGRRRVLNKQEFSDYVERIKRFAASKGIHIPDPGEMEQEEAA